MGLCTAIKHLVVLNSFRSSAQSSVIQRTESGPAIAKEYVRGFPEGSRLSKGNYVRVKAGCGSLTLQKEQVVNGNVVVNGIHRSGGTTTR